MVPVASGRIASLLIADHSASLQARLSEGQAARAGATVPAVTAVASGAVLQARAAVTESLFDAAVPDPLAMKIDLMERLGREFGISMDDFDTQFSFGKAIKAAVADIMSKPGGYGVLREIGAKLGLDELGISVTTLVDAIVEPGGEADEKLDAAVREKAGELGGERGSAGFRVLFDENGLYAV